MPEVRLDMEGGKLDKKKEELSTRIMGNRGILALRLLGIPHTLFPVLIELPTDRILRHLLAEVQWHATLLFNRGARILRAIAAFEVHLSPSYVLFNLKALSIVIAKKVALSEKFLLAIDIGDCCGR
jgi:hypothetical protein